MKLGGGGWIGVPADRKNKAQWGTKRDLQNILGLSDSGIEKIRNALGNVAEEKGNPVKYFLPEWFRAWARYTSGVLNEDDEVDQPNADSPWLEEKRKWSALRERSRYETETGKLVPLDEVHKGYGLVAGHWRRAAESCCESCKGLIDAALDDAELEVDRVFNDCLGDESDD